MLPPRNKHSDVRTAESILVFMGDSYLTRGHTRGSANTRMYRTLYALFQRHISFKLTVKWQLKEPNPSHYRKPWWELSFNHLRALEEEKEGVGGLRRASWEFVRHDWWISSHGRFNCSPPGAEENLTDGESEEARLKSWLQIVLSASVILGSHLWSAKNTKREFHPT